MDNIDKKILHLLQENARYPLNGKRTAKGGPVTVCVF